MASFADIIGNQSLQRNQVQQGNQNVQFASIACYNDPYYISGSDNPGIAIVSPLFNGDNYLRWSRNIKRALGAKNKLCFLDGSLPEPADDHKDYHAWNRCNYLVVSWLIHSMTPDFADDFSYIDDAKVLWQEITERYGHYNGPLIYQLKKESSKLRQENLTVVSYYNKLRKLWDELHSIRSLPSCTFGVLK